MQQQLDGSLAVEWIRSQQVLSWFWCWLFWKLIVFLRLCRHRLQNDHYPLGRPQSEAGAVVSQFAARCHVVLPSELAYEQLLHSCQLFLFVLSFMKYMCHKQSIKQQLLCVSVITVLFELLTKLLRCLNKKYLLFLIEIATFLFS